MSAPDTSTYKFLAMTLHGWGSGPTEKDAIAACRSHNGHSHVAKYGYVVYRVHPRFQISEIDGTIYTPAGHPPIKVTDRIKRKRGK